MATTNFREDFLGRNLQAPTVNALEAHPVTASEIAVNNY
jgi:hypothetical protein